MRKLWTLVSSRRGRGVIAVMVLGVLAVGAVNLDQRSAKQRAESWAASHAPSSMTLEELAAYSTDYRQAIFNALPPAEQSRLWHVQLQHVLDTDSSLTSDQRTFIVNTMALATPASFMKDMPKPNVCTDIAHLFTNKVQKETIRTIAAGIAPKATAAATWVTVSEKFRSSVSMHAARFGCSCSGLGLCECGLFSSCITGDCDHNQNCGCIWAGECDKMCDSLLPEMNMKAPSPTSSTSSK